MAAAASTASNFRNSSVILAQIKTPHEPAGLVRRVASSCRQAAHEVQITEYKLAPHMKPCCN